MFFDNQKIFNQKWILTFPENQKFSIEMHNYENYLLFNSQNRLNNHFSAIFSIELNKIITRTFVT